MPLIFMTVNYSRRSLENGPTWASELFNPIGANHLPLRIRNMSQSEKQEDRTVGRTRKKVNVDQQQEETVMPQSAHGERDVEHGDELQYASHSSVWEIQPDQG